ncbi:MAG: beta-lactamase family protein [Saprospiraceae bacterium]|nr:beta-lactamase family protein [Saprospiraceae bacterium]MCF8249776.1 beta-lactamase family protein [Saprospiraceae bacterium]MCF8279261.1 beta-lactamase family protein [Bacteroidales bacterium]MCF8312809.1 beta-lactamase family protein [Saprospiraceae bacterium]MCF8441256.1 beta-lactamase family protein [Saprospiraceae bacterium]
MKKYALLLCCCMVTLLAFSQTKSIKNSPLLTEATPESQGFSTERMNRLDGFIEQSVKDGDIPGAVLLIARNGKIIHWKAFGMADNTSKRAMKRDDIFRIASQSKAITSTAVMMLWEQGKFQLDDPISKYIPEFKNPQVLKDFTNSDTSWTTEPAKSEITIRHLLTHTSGLGYGIIDGDERFKMMYHKAGVTDLFTTENISISESVKKLATLPLHHQPGEKFTYSEGLDVLGYFIEVVSGEPFDVYLRKHIFDPLGMSDTWFYLPSEKASRLVTVQKPENGQWVRYPITFYDTDYPIKGAKRFFSGGAGLSSTAKDYATFLQMYLNGGELNGKRLLSRTTVDAVLSNQVGDLFPWDSGKGFGLAFGILNDKGEAKGGNGSAGTFDWGGYFNTTYFADPQEKIIGILMKQTQGYNGDETSGYLRQLIYQGLDD